ncbi:hypothetical protein CAEBREN_20911 [Caenorhabditis brenneri]|uniref:Uncharacterized protein n=1 Tax=Caenorhabditis brenneri TaxID=135651 RepID=G0NBP7_CAEBE|nr:hypothetical protein CAEBREN_20911 [Caenorhabditis brenneri]
MTRGIVVTNGTPTEGMVFHMALLFDHSYHSVRDFTMMPVQLKIKEKMRPGKRLGTHETVLTEDTLIYGDVLEWPSKDARGRPIEFVREYRKVREVYQTRLFDGEPQILLQGIMSKNRKVLWMVDIWPDLEIPHRIQQMAHPNVTVNAWVILKIRENQTLKYELHSFKETADSFQFLVRKAKWNEGQLGNLSVLYDPVDEKPQNQEYQSTLADTLTGMHGIVISKKIVLDTSHPGYCFHRIVIRDGDNYPENGKTIRFNAERLEFLNIYAIKDLFVVTNEKQMPLTPNGRVKVTISPATTLHGFYYCKTLNCYVDDPDNILEVWLLSEYSKSALQVGITATEPSTKGTPRFVVAEITDKKLAKLNAFKAEGKMILTDESGIAPNNFRFPVRPGNYTYRDVWIAINDCHPGEIIKPQLKFKYVAVAELEMIQADALRICPKVVVVSNVPDYPDSLSGVDDSFIEAESVMNNVDVPPVFAAMPDEEFEKELKTRGGSVEKMMEELERNPRWHSDPKQLIGRQIEDHLRSCEACADRKFSADCFFAEYLSRVIDKNMGIMEVLKQDIISILLARRFRN